MNMPALFPKLEAWRRADESAREASAELLARRKAYFEGHGPKPTEADVAEAERLRIAAVRSYAEAVQEMEHFRAGIARDRDV